MPLFNIFSNRPNDFTNSSDKENNISRYQSRNAISPWLLAIWKNSIADPIEIDKSTSRKNRNTNHFNIKEEMRYVNSITSNTSFYY